MNRRCVPSVAVLISDYDVAISWYCDVLSLFAPVGDVNARKRVGNVALRFCNEAFPFQVYLKLASTPAECALIESRFEGLHFLNIPIDDGWQIVNSVKAKGGKVIGHVKEMSYGNMATVEDPFGNRIGLNEWW
jgi:hypothetical protein